MPIQVKILIVEDDKNVRQGLAEALTGARYETLEAESGEEALVLLANQKFDLVLLDLKLTGINGLEVLAALRQTSPDTVAIVLTAHASLETAVTALRLGAHDYLFKPCRPDELCESIRRGLLKRQEVLRRTIVGELDSMTTQLETIRTTLANWQDNSPPAPMPAIEDQERFLQRDNLVVDFMRHLVTVEGHLLDLSPTEFNLLTHLIRNAPRVVSSQELVDKIRGYESEQWEASELVRQHIYRIRQKIREVTNRQDIIHTARGLGYSIGN